VRVVHEQLEFCSGRSEDLCVKTRRTPASDSPSGTGWRLAERCRLLSVTSLATAVFSAVRIVFTLPPFFFSVEPVASEFRTQVLRVAWADGAARLR